MSSDKKNFELSRRALLKNLMMGTGMYAGMQGPVNIFLSNMIIHFLQKGTAHAAGEEAAFQDIKLISLIMAGGLPRYYWDLPITPNQETAIYNPMVTNRFRRNGSEVEAFYSSTKVGDYYMPHMWSGNMPTTAGVSSMKNLAQNMLIMRGLDLQIDSHDIDRGRQMAPVSGGVSLTGLIADKAKSPIPAIGRNGGGATYRGERGIAYVDMAGTNPLSAAMAPFVPNSSMASLNNGDIEKAIDSALQRMSAFSSDKSRYLPSTFATRFNAKKLMMREFSNLQGSYTTLVNKYKGLINRSFDATGSLSLTGVDDLTIPGTPGTAAAALRMEENEYFTGSDLRTITDALTTIPELAEGMAVAEYMITQGLSSSVNVLASGSINNMIYQQSYNPATKSIVRTNGRVNHTTDVHFMGAHAGIVTFSRYYRAVSACLNELILQLSSVSAGNGQSLFDRTVISVTSEFNRIPRMDGSGADHGWRGSNYTLISGMIPQFTVVGNIMANKENRGTWGDAAPIEELGGREAILGNAASTVAALTEVSSPTPNDQSFVYKENGKMKLSIRPLKNVA